MPLPAGLRERLSLPLIAAPMTIVSGAELVTACCKAGVIGAFPTANGRRSGDLDGWINAINDDLARFSEENPGKPVAPLCANLIVHRTNENLAGDLASVIRCKVELVIASVGSPEHVIPPIHDYGGIVFADVASMRHVEKAAAAGADGLILLTAGAGGNTGWANPFSFVRQAREIFDGPLILTGGLADGASLRAAEILGCELGNMGTRFIATQESAAVAPYRQMVVDATLDDIILTRAITGLQTNILRQSLEDAGLDPDNLPEHEGYSSTSKKRWRDIWSAGHTSGSIHDIPTVAELVERLKEEYEAAGG
jgi:nitronate monooxygenase